MNGHERVRVTTIALGLCTLLWLTPDSTAWAGPQEPTVSSPKPHEASGSHSLIQRPKKKAVTKSPGPHTTEVDTKTRTAETQPRGASAVSAAPTRPEAHTAGDLPSSISSSASPASSVTPSPSGRNNPGSAAASITVPTIPLVTRESNRSTTASAAPGATANSGHSAGAATSRGFSNLLARFPQLGQAVNTQAASAPAIPTEPIPTINAPIPQNPEAPSSGTSRGSTPPASTALGSAALSWSPNAEADIGGYKIYLGTRSGVYDYPGSPFTVGNTTRTVINNLPQGHTYYFAATAYDLSGNESAHSAEVSKSLY